MIHYPLRLTLTALLLAVVFFAAAQFPYLGTFKNAASPGLVISGSARLTAAAGIDAPGNGYLRLTENINNSIGYAYAEDSFPSNYGLTVRFEFFDWKVGATATNQADGLCFFLFDASVNSFRPGGIGGALGYAQYYATPGMAKAYLGVSLDEFGNFSSPSDGNKNGGPGQRRGSVVIRGPGNGRGATDYMYQTGVVASDPPYNAGFLGFAQRYPDSTSANWRRLQIILTPGSSLGPALGYKITVIMHKGGTPVTPVTLIDNVDYPFVAPAQLQFGLAASTGSISNYQEIRNLSVEPTATASLLAPTAAPDEVTLLCQGQEALLDVTANDISNNAGGFLNKATVDLDPATPGMQATYTDAGKGTFINDAAGIVRFTPQAGFTGESVINYTVNDSYGTLSAPAAIKVIVSSATGPSLTLTNPAAVCAPLSVDITAASLKSNTTAGATYDYFSSLAAANTGTAALSASAATAINQSGTYYVRALANGCPTVKPLTVTINTAPSTANAGSSQTICNPSSVPQSSTLLATNPDVGTGSWTQLSGPTAVAINYPAAATTPVAGLDAGLYTFRWTVANGACPVSQSSVQVALIAAKAGANQVVSGSSATLQANSSSPGTGLWTQLSGPAATITAPSNPASTVTGLVAGNSYTFSWKITYNSCSSTSQATVTASAVLPTTLLAFTGDRQAGGANLQWQTGGEEGLKRFRIERSADDSRFEAIGETEAKGTMQTGAGYRYFDGTVPSATVYYRLALVHANGAATYSNVIALRGSAATAWQLGPNPVAGQLFVSGYAAKAGPVTIRLFDASGRLLLRQQEAGVKGQNSFTLHLPAGARGLFLAEIWNEGRVQGQLMLAVP